MNEWPRRDKTYNINYTDIASIDEFKHLHKLLSYLYYLPFELNS
jgi:hypothetical protein